MSPYKLLFQFARKRPGWILLTIVLGWAGAFFNGISTALIVPLILGFLGQEVNLKGAPEFLERTMSFFDQASGNYRLILMMGVILLAIIFKNATSYASTLSSAYFSKVLIEDIRIEGIKLLLAVDLDYYSKTKIGDIINYIGHEVNRAASAIRIGIQLLTQVITVWVFVGIMIAISWQLTVGSTIILISVPLISQYFINQSKEYGELLSEKSRLFSNNFIETLNGIRLVKSTANEDREYEKVIHGIHERQKAELQSEINYGILGPINEVTGVAALLAIVTIGRVLFAEQIESLYTVMLTYLFLLNRLMPVIGQLNTSRSRLANVIPSTVIVGEFLRRDNKPLMKNGYILFTNLSEGIRFEGVCFSYPGHKDRVLDHIDLWIPRGTTIALVGGSGSGKSTLADLVPRFYDPTAGRITIDGQDLKDYDLKTLRRVMGIVSQDTFLFNDSVRNNIAYARPEASEQEVIAAAKMANAYEFIMQLPQGFNTPIGDRGILLSGGQRQRIAIARALLIDPDILILDEATSALDTVSEHLVQQAIERLSRDRTTIVIAHRLSTIQKADQIAVLEKGCLVEIGTHEQLLKKGDYYSRLYAMQFSEDSQELMLTKARNETLMNTSYEIRTRLNPMIGYLRLLVDDVADSVEERSDYTQQAYESAIRLLNTLEFLENNAKQQMK